MRLYQGEHFIRDGLGKNDFSLARMLTKIGLIKLNSPSYLKKKKSGESLANSVAKTIQKACVFSKQHSEQNFTSLKINFDSFATCCLDPYLTSVWGKLAKRETGCKHISMVFYVLYSSSVIKQHKNESACVSMHQRIVSTTHFVHLLFCAPFPVLFLHFLFLNVTHRCVARNLQCGGLLFRRCETKLNQFTLGIGTVLWPKLGKDQKKGFRPGWDRFFATEFFSSPELK